MSILIYNCTAVLMDAAGTILRNAFVTVEGPKILSVGTQRPAGPFDEEIDGGGNVLMPGLVNAHTHVPMTLLRGYGDGHDLQDWLNNYIFPCLLYTSDGGCQGVFVHKLLVYIPQLFQKLPTGQHLPGIFTAAD